MKSLAIIFVILIIGIAFISIWDLSGNRVIDDTNYNEISWRLPNNQELEKVSKSFVKSSITLCGDYFIKKFEGEKYLIACEEVTGTWTYYTVYAGQNKVYRTSKDLAMDFLPPNLRKKDTKKNIVKHSPLPKKNNVILPDKKSTAETK